MNLSEIKPFLKLGKLGRIPGWVGYLKWDYFLNKMYFNNGDYIMKEDELEKTIKSRNDLYYII